MHVATCRLIVGSPTYIKCTYKEKDVSVEPPYDMLRINRSESHTLGIQILTLILHICNNFISQNLISKRMA